MNARAKARAEEQKQAWEIWERERKRHKRTDPQGTDRGRIVTLTGVFGAWAREPKIAGALRQATIIARWEEIVGPQVAAQAQPERLEKNGRLIVRVEDSTWRHQLLYMRRELIGKIAAVAGQGIVKEIVFTA